jgi:hypothetical protein
MSNRDAIMDELMQDVPVLKNRIDNIETAHEKHQALLDKLTENCSLLSQRVVSTEEKSKHSDYMLKWLLGIIAGSFAGILALLFQAYLKK